MKQKLKLYSYPLKVNGKNYMAYYTIKDGVEPLKFQGEKLINTFEAEVK